MTSLSVEVPFPLSRWPNVHDRTLNDESNDAAKIGIPLELMEAGELGGSSPGAMFRDILGR